VVSRRASSSAAKFALLLTLATLAAPSGQVPASGLDLMLIDPTVRPQDDLFRAANGRWLARAVVSPDRVTFGTFTELADKTESDLRVIVEGVAATRERQRGSARQIADLYASVMDQRRTDELGLRPVAHLLRSIDAVKTPADLAARAGELSALALGGLFPGGVEEDLGRPGSPIVKVSEGGTLLPDRGYYTSEDDRLRRIRARYLEYLATIFGLAGRARAEAEAHAVLALETAIAGLQSEPAESRDPTPARRLTLAALSREMPGFDWARWAAAQGVPPSGAVVLAQPSFFRGVAALLERTPLDTSRAWLRARLLTAAAPYLTTAFSDARFEFFGRELSGQELPRTHWKRGVSLVNGFLGDAVGRLYVERHFPASSRARVEAIVAALVRALRQAIEGSSWMSDHAKRGAIAKLSALTTRVGYPDRWRSYSGLAIRADDLFGNVQRARQFEAAYKLARVLNPVPNGEWFMTPQTVNAYYNPVLNEVVVPAAMLQPPLFNAGADDAANFGAIGAIVGHELAHGFDDRGRRLDGRGRPADWWTPADDEAFAARARMLVDQFDAYSPMAGAHVNGALTLHENVGDVSGLEIAWRAYTLSLNGRPSPVIDGFTGEQRFFLSWAQAWKGGIRREYLVQTLRSTPHAPPEYRANGPASNLAGFYDAFGVKPGDRMYREPSRRVSFW
jgi:predicted metalloendopeptidase